MDIVCRERNVVCFVEVKTRTYRDPVHRPAEAVNKEKQQLIKRGARDWLSRLRIRRRVSWRYDIVEVLLLEGELPEVKCIVDAFGE